MTFGAHKFTTTIVDVVQARQVDLINTPERREQVGVIEAAPVLYSPTVVTFICAEGKLHFVLEDIQNIVETLQGITIIMLGEVKVTFCRI